MDGARAEIAPYPPLGRYVPRVGIDARTGDRPKLPLIRVCSPLGPFPGIDHRGPGMTSHDPVSGIRPVLNGTEAADYLNLPSPKSVQRLVDRGELCPLGYSKSNLFALGELQRFVSDSQLRERAIRGLNR